MRNMTKNMMFAAAALVVAAGVAPAQVIKAEIPFSFRAGGVVMPAGEYRVRPAQTAGSVPIFQLKHADSSRAVYAMPYVSDSHSKAGVDPKLTFECGEGHCALVKLDPGAGSTYKFPHPGLGKDERTSVAVIRAVLVSSR